MLTIAVSSRALFHMDDSHAVFEAEGQAGFDAYMRARETVPLRQGTAFPLVQKLLALNTPGIERDRVEVILLSRNSPDAGIRVLRSARHYGVDIERAVFAQGADRFKYAEALGAHLFLSVNQADVAAAVRHGLAAAALVSRPAQLDPDDGAIRVAFDGDSVLFSDDADQYFREHGLQRFQEHEAAQVFVPLPAGPFKAFLQELSVLQRGLPPNAPPIKLALVTARSCPAHERALRTLQGWGIRLDEAIFTGGRPKGPLLKAFGADMFFDDTKTHVDSAHQHGVACGHVPYGTGQGIAMVPVLEPSPAPIRLRSAP